jgi:hypothetical protein
MLLQKDLRSVFAPSTGSSYFIAIIAFTQVDGWQFESSASPSKLHLIIGKRRKTLCIDGESVNQESPRL